MQKVAIQDIAPDERHLIIDTLCLENGINLADLLDLKYKDIQPFLKERQDTRALHLKVISWELD